MSSRWLTKLVLAIAIAVLPLQALAETVRVFLCHLDVATAEMAVETDSQEKAADHHHGTASHAHHGHGHHGGHAGASDDSAGNPGDHFCCDAATAALPLPAKLLPPSYSPSVVVTAETPHHSAFLKLPQRPPLA
jgi:hypothetical protein